MRDYGIAIYRGLGAALAIAVMEILATTAGEPLSRVPFVTSIVLAMSLPNSITARPHIIVGGHMLCCVAGFVALHMLGPGETASAVAVGLATLLMLGFRILHPPASINAFLIGFNNLPFFWAIEPVLIGAIMLAAMVTIWRFGEHTLFGRPD